MENIIKKLNNRKRTTTVALGELFTLIEELEKSLDQDITTDSTKTKVRIKADEYIQKDPHMEGFYRLADGEFNLKIENGYIKIVDIFEEKIEHCAEGVSKSFRYFSNDDETNLLRIDFKQTIKALQELMQLASNEAERIDNDAQEFINFCESWKKRSI